MTTIYINKQHAATEGTISIGFAYEKTVLHYLKRFFKNPKYNPQMKIWTVQANDETGLMLFLRATQEWCKIEIIDPAAAAAAQPAEIVPTEKAETTNSAAANEISEVFGDAVAFDFGETIPQMQEKLEYYQENEMVREADEMRRFCAASKPKKQTAAKTKSNLYDYEETGELPPVIIEWAKNLGGAMRNRIKQYLSPNVQKSKTMKIFWARQIMDLATPGAWVSYYNARAGQIGGQSKSDAKKQPAAPMA